MTLIALLRSESSINWRRLALVAVVAATANALVLAIVNAAAGGSTSVNPVNVRYATMFALVLVTYTFSQRYLLFEASRELERIIHRIRTRLVEAVRTSELREIEEIGRNEIFAVIGQQMQMLSQTCNLLIPTVQMAMLVIFTTFYLISLSITSFVLASAFMAVVVTMYLARAKSLEDAMAKAGAAEQSLTELLVGVLDGFKESKLNAQRSRHLADDVVTFSEHAAEERTNVQNEYARTYIFTQNVFFLLLGTMVFIVPTFAPVSSSVLVKTTTAVLFVFGALAGVIGSIPTFSTASACAARIMKLEARLGVAPEGSASVATPDTKPSQRFKRIEMRDVRYRYPNGGAGFAVGPFDLVIEAGETIFISGGNGSGKSTFLRLLTTLYWPDSGTILVDGVPVTRENAQAYRDRFASVFSDFHLFTRLYGIHEETLDEAPGLLETFEVAEKTTYADGAFSTTALSTGQRKRLALIVAMLESRPICILDEWAADQDPLFRKRFYGEILPLLRDRGVSVIAVSHDDRYFDTADRRLHMDEGMITTDTRATIHA